MISKNADLIFGEKETNLAALHNNVKSCKEIPISKTKERKIKPINSGLPYIIKSEISLIFASWVQKKLKEEVEKEFNDDKNEGLKNQKIGEFESNEKFEKEKILDSLKIESNLKEKKIISESGNEKSLEAISYPSISVQNITTQVASDHQESMDSGSSNCSLYLDCQINEIFEILKDQLVNEGIKVEIDEIMLKERIRRILEFKGDLTKKFLFEILIGNDNFKEENNIQSKAFEFFCQVLEF